MAKKRKNPGTVRNRDENFQLKKKKEIYSRANSVDAFHTAEVLLNPDPVLITRLRDWHNYRDIFWDPHLTAVVSSRKAKTLGKKWFITQNESSEQVHKFVEKAFTLFDVNRSTNEILDALLFGMQPMEPIWAKPVDFDGEGKIFPIEFTGRPPWWFQYDNENLLRFRTMANSWPGEKIKNYSLIVPRNNPKYDNPYGESLYSKIYWSLNFKKAAFKFWIEFAEKYGSPFIEGKVPRNAGDEEYDALFDRLTEGTKGSVFVIPSDAEIILHDGTKSKGEVYKELIDFANSEISKAILGQTLTTEAGDKGARALGEVHENVADDLAESDEMLCEGCFNQLIKWIVDINFGEGFPVPEFKYEHEEDIKKDRVERDKGLKELGVKFNDKYFIKNYNLNEDEFKMVEVEDPNKLKDAKDKIKGKIKEKPEFAEAKTPEDQKALDAFIESLTPEYLQSLSNPLVDPIIKLVEGASSYSEIQDKLLGLVAKIDPSLLEKDLGKAMFNSENLGHGTDGDT